MSKQNFHHPFDLRGMVANDYFYGHIFHKVQFAKNTVIPSRYIQRGMTMSESDYPGSGALLYRVSEEDEAIMKENPNAFCGHKNLNRVGWEENS